jgi:DnaJ-class molecular chaperone
LEERRNRKVLYEVMEVKPCRECEGKGFHLCDKVVQEARFLVPAITVRASEMCRSCSGRGYHDD